MHVCELIFLPCRTVKLLTSAVCLVIEAIAIFIITLILYKTNLVLFGYETAREALTVLTTDDLAAALIIDIIILVIFMLGLLAYECCTGKKVELPNVQDKPRKQRLIMCWDYWCCEPDIENGNMELDEMDL